MAFHRNIPSMLRESLPEFVDVARYAMTTKKPDGGFYGYPAAALLLAVAAAIGSWYEGNEQFRVIVDGKERTIDGDTFKHFFVLNSELYGQALSEREIRTVYDVFRNPLLHNAAMKPGGILTVGQLGDPAFYPRPDGSGVECINLHGLLDLTARAVERFLAGVNSVVPGSRREILTHAAARAAVRKSRRRP